MKKILFVIGSMNHGGTESQLINLMKSLDTNKFDISIFIMEAKGPLLKDLNSIEINKKYFGGFRSHKNRLISYFRFFRTVFYLFKIMLFNRYHLVQSYLPLTNFLTSFLGIFTLQRVWTGWRGMTDHQKVKPYFRILDSLSNLLSRGINANAEAILKDKNEKEFFMSFKKSTVVKNYILFNKQKLSLDEISKERHKLGVHDSEKILLCVSNLIPYKGHLDLFTAMKEIPREFKLFYVGRNDGILDDLNDFIDKNNLQERITYLGYKNKDELNVLYNISDLYVSPSHTEGISNSLIESLFYSLPTVATPVGGNLELLENGKLGFICNVKDPKDMAKKIIEASKVKPKDFSEYIIKKYSKESMLATYFKSWEIN